MPYIHLDLPGTYPAETKRALAGRLCRLYAEVMETQTWRPNVGISELGPDNLLRLGPDGPEPVAMALVEVRRGRPPEMRLRLGQGIVAACAEALGLPPARIFVEFTAHAGDEMLRDGAWAAEWSPEEAGGAGAGEGA